MDRLSSVIPMVMRAASQRKEYGLQNSSNYVINHSRILLNRPEMGSEGNQVADRNRINNNNNNTENFSAKPSRRSVMVEQEDSDAMVRQTLIRQAFVPLY